MMKLDLRTDWQKNKLFWLLGGCCLANFIVHLCFYPALPATIPIHWGADGAVNGYGPKVLALALAALPALLLVMFRFLPRMDPKAENYEKFKPIWNAFVVGTTVLIIGVSWLTELAVFGMLPESSSIPGLLVGGGCGLLFILLGNYMPRIKQNYTFGCKTPWALADEHNWNRTQRMGGIVFVVSGAVMLLCSLLLCAVTDDAFGGALVAAMVAVILVGALWIYIYSFLLFKGKMK